MATSARELLTMAGAFADNCAAPDVPDAESAITALRYVSAALCRAAAAGLRHGAPWAVVDQLAHACREASAEWPARPGPLPDLVGAACDLLARDDHPLTTDDRWAVAVELATAARRCSGLALRHPPYSRVPALRWVHAAAAAVERHALRAAPPRAVSVLDQQIPATDRDPVVPAAGLVDAFADLLTTLHREAATGPLPISAALAVAAVAEEAARWCITDKTIATGPVRDLGETTAASWRVVRAAVTRFDDGSRGRRAASSATVASAVQLHAHLIGCTDPGPPSAHLPPVRARLASQLPLVARELRRAAAGWQRHRGLFAHARDLVRRDELVPHILAHRVVPAGTVDLLPVLRAIQTAERVSTAFAGHYADTRWSVAAPRMLARPEVHADAQWVSRLAARTQMTARADSRPGL